MSSSAATVNFDQILKEWGDAKVLKRFEHGVVNDVRLIELDGRPAVARLSSKSEASLQWECELLAYLANNALHVPSLIPSSEGRVHANGLMVMELIDGRPPTTSDDWQLVASYLRTIHELTREWEQRPGCPSSLDLVHSSQATELLDFTALPPDTAEQCRMAWRRLENEPMSVVHGDPNKNNVFITDNGVVLIDWDEARVDVSLLDLAGLPHDQQVLSEDKEWAAKQAFFAWEAAICWIRQPEEAMRCLGELQPENVASETNV